jgi:hypothetical protein
MLENILFKSRLLETKYYRTELEISLVEYSLIAKHEAYDKILESPPFDTLEGVLFLAGFGAELTVYFILFKDK